MSKKKSSIINHQSSIILILLFGIVLRLININQSLWLDEAISFEAVTKHSFSNLFNKFLIKDFNPPLYYLFLYFWLKIFPASELFLRLPSVIFGILTCIMVYKIYDLIFKDKKEALLSLILLTTSPLHIYYSQEARSYSLAAFFVSASMYYFIKLLRNKNRLFTIHYSLFTIFMLYSHYLSWLILPVQWLYFYISKKWKSKKISINFLISQFLNLSFYIPWLPIFFKQLNIGKTVGVSSRWGRVLGGASFKNIALLPVKFIIGRTSFENGLLYSFIALLLILFFGFLLWKAFKSTFFQFRLEQTEPGSEKLIWLWLMVPLVLGIVISLKIPVFSYFRFLFCLPAFYLLIARGVFSFKRTKIFITILLIINLFFSFKYLINKDFHRENWKKATAVLHEKNISNSPVLIFKNVSAPFNYYDKNKSKLVFIEEKELISNKDTVWFIPYAQPIFDPQDKTRKFLELNDFIRVYEEHFRGVTLEKWQKIMAKKV